MIIRATLINMGNFSLINKYKLLKTETNKCPDCGAKLIENWSGEKCGECDYWFCF